MTNSTVQQTVEELEYKGEQITCVHHWIIDEPEGPVSKGYCKKCGEEREFQNYFPHSIWEGKQTDEEVAKSLLSEWGI